MTNNAKAALKKIRALRRISVETGLVNTRAQRDVLIPLSPEDLTAVATALMDEEVVRG